MKGELLPRVPRKERNRVCRSGAVALRSARSQTVQLAEESQSSQDYALWPHMVPHDNVAFALKRRGVDRAAARHEATAMLERVGLEALALR